jgi:hypothetical protein
MEATILDLRYLIAATAVESGQVLATANDRHFRFLCGLEVKAGRGHGFDFSNRRGSHRTKQSISEIYEGRDHY